MTESFNYHVKRTSRTTWQVRRERFEGSQLISDTPASIPMPWRGALELCRQENDRAITQKQHAFQHAIETFKDEEDSEFRSPGRAA